MSCGSKASVNIKRLYPLRKTYPQCEVQRATKYLSDSPETDRQCALRAVIEINGVKMCRKHAGAVALDLLLDNRIHLRIEDEA